MTALSGYVDRPDGETLIFSILVNGKGGGSEVGIEAVDRIAETLLETPIETPIEQTPVVEPLPPVSAAPESELETGKGDAERQAQDGRVALAGSRTKARITESMYSEGSVSPSRRR